jgi:outer membrane protein assembly factor BamB
MRGATGWLGVLTGSVAAATPGLAADPVQNWPQFRGPQASGLGLGHALPDEFDVASAKNVRWKSDLPGLGLGGPIVWGDQVFVTTAVSAKDNTLKVGLYGDIAPVEDDSVHTWNAYALDRATGKTVWEKKLHEGVPRVKRHTKASHISSTAATDGKSVVIMRGSEALHCLDAATGEQRWVEDFGALDSGFYMVPAAQWGFASSPIIHDGRVILQVDVNGKDASFLAAFDLADGREIWRTPRSDVPTWSTPTVIEVAGRKQIVCNGYKHIGAYDFETGKELWKLAGGGDIPVPTPIVAHDLIFITSAHGPQAPIFAIKTGATGDITLEKGATSNAHIPWMSAKRGNYMQTPLVYDDLLYTCADNGVLSVYDARTGDVTYRKRLGDGASGFTASPVAGDGKVYFTAELGEVHVLKHGREFEVLSVSNLDANCMATPAIAAGTLFFRTDKGVVAVGG